MVRYRTLPQFILTNRYVARRPESLSDYPVLNEIPPCTTFRIGNFPSQQQYCGQPCLVL